MVAGYFKEFTLVSFTSDISCFSWKPDDDSEPYKIPLRERFAKIVNGF